MSGMTSGIAFFFEYPSIVLALAIHLRYVLRRRGMEITKAIVVAGGFAAAVLIYNVIITGRPLDFPYYHLIGWPGSPFEAGAGQFSFARISLQRIWETFFFGQPFHPGEYYYQGFFLYSPLLMIALAYSGREHLVFLLGFLSLVVLYTGETSVVGGCVFSNRFLVPAIPVLGLPAITFAQRRPVMFAVAASISVIISSLGAMTVPWSCARFPLGDATVRLLPTLFQHKVAGSVTVVLTAMVLVALFHIALQRRSPA